MVAVALFLGTTRLGTAIRGSAERSERALMLGIPVSWLSTLVWSIAAALSFLALFLRAGILGVLSQLRQERSGPPPLIGVGETGHEGHVLDRVRPLPLRPWMMLIVGRIQGRGPRKPENAI